MGLDLPKKPRRNIMWRIKWYYEKIKTWISYIKDYERISYDYACVLCHSTCNRMSKTNYKRDDIYSEIDDAQSSFWYGVIKSDIEVILNNKKLTDTGKINQIKKYLKTIN